MTTTALKNTMKSTYGALFDEVSAALFADDPMSVNVGNNTDQYDAEAAAVLPRLQAAHSADDVQVIVFEEFCKTSDKAKAGDVGRYEEVSEIIWEAWLRFAAKSKPSPT